VKNDTHELSLVLHVEIMLYSVLRQLSLVRILGSLAISVFVPSGHRVTLKNKKTKRVIMKVT